MSNKFVTVYLNRTGQQWWASFHPEGSEKSWNIPIETPEGIQLTGKHYRCVVEFDDLEVYETQLFGRLG